MLLEDLDAAFTRGVSRDENSTGAPAAPPLPGDDGKKVSDGESTLTLSGLLNSFDGVAAVEGRRVPSPAARISVSSRLTQFAFSLLFATTNHIERLDPALSRPGRMDVWIHFKNATKWQAEEIFRNFFPCQPSEPPAPPTTSQGGAVERKERLRRRANAPVLNEDELSDLAKRFADAIPEDELSVS